MSMDVASTDRFDSTSARANAANRTESSLALQAGVLSRKAFVDQVRIEKRRAERSRAPLSLVVITLPADGSLDAEDVRDIVRDLTLRKRETDFIAYLGRGIIGFLLPYAEPLAAETFSKMILARVGVPAAVVSHATHGDGRFDELVEASMAAGANGDEFVSFGDRAARRVWTLAVKRAIDLVGAISLLVISSPLMAATAIAVKLSSPGPIVFRQQRVGRGGVPFVFYKFRSMRTGADDQVHREYVAKLIEGRHDEVNQGDSQKPLYKLQSDPRITPIGRIIRKTSIDELPQLFNVLKGDMSLVGPRPPIAYETEKYQSWHMRRLQEVRPGITGLWQVEGRSRTSFDDMVRLDLSYIRNWSLLLDIKILLKTLFVIVRGDGAD